MALESFVVAQIEAVKGDELAAFAAFVRSAEHGHVKALFQVGLRFEKGLGVAKNLERAQTCFLIAAEAGDRASGQALACLYAKEGKVERAKFWFNKSCYSEFYVDPKIYLRFARLYAKSNSVRATVRARRLLMIGFWSPALDEETRRELISVWQRVSARNIDPHARRISR